MGVKARRGATNCTGPTPSSSYTQGSFLLSQPVERARPRGLMATGGTTAPGGPRAPPKMAAAAAAALALTRCSSGGSASPSRRGPAGGMEPLLGWQFEDSLFTPSRERGPGGGARPPYGAKHCEPRWFHREAGADGEDADALTGIKFRADWAYRRRDFEKALGEYSKCLLLLPPSNIAMRRDVQESQARCLSHLGRHKEALDIAEEMQKGATNTDHLTAVLNLQLAIYQGLENADKKITCLQQLICLHPFNPQYWKLLAEAYMSFLELVIPETNLNQSEDVRVRDSSFKTSAATEINLQPCRSDGQKEGPQCSLATETKRENAVTCNGSRAAEFPSPLEELERTDQGKCAASKSWEQSMPEKAGIKACASFIRARLLLQLTQSQQSSFALERNIKGQKEIDGKVARLGFSENSLLLMIKVMGRDLTPEKEEFQGEVKCIGPSVLSSLVTASATEFEINWFGNLQDDLCHFDRQFCSDTHLPPLVT